MNCPVCSKVLLEITPYHFHCSQTVNFYSCDSLPHYEIDASMRSIVVAHPYIIVERLEDKHIVIRKFYAPDQNIHQFNPYSYTSIIAIVPTTLIASTQYLYDIPRFNLEDLKNKIKRIEKLKIFY